MIRVALFPAIGSPRVEEIPPAVGPGHEQLDAVRKLIGGGYIEIVSLFPGVVLICDEDGKGKGLPVNYGGTAMLARWLQHGDFLVGTVLLAGSDGRGDLADLPGIDQLLQT